jgi:antirestriction protein ArdC
MLPLMRLAATAGYSVCIEPMPARYGGVCIPGARKIAINKNNVINHQVKTLVHELGHMLFRVEREEHDLELSYSEEELVVESIAFTVCGSLALDTAAFSIPYLAGWSQRAGMDTIERAAGMIDRVAKRIEEFVIPRA